MHIMVTIVVAALALALVGTRAAMVRERPLLPVAFEHRDHTPEQCVLCHHNYEDDTGYDSCYSCHKHDPAVAADIEQMFHDFCRACHVERARRGEPSGPFRVCRECHHEGGRMSQNLPLQMP